MRNMTDLEVIELAHIALDTGEVRQALSHLQCERREEVISYLIDLIVRASKW